MRKNSDWVYRIIIVLLCVSAFALYTNGAPAPAVGSTPESVFTSYGYSYVKVRNVETQKLTYMVADKVATHCCGDMKQLADLTLSGNDIARNYIMHQWEKELDDFNLQPNFVKCLRTETEAEASRLKKVELFKKLGYQVVVIPMEQKMATACK